MTLTLAPFREGLLLLLLTGMIIAASCGAPAPHDPPENHRDDNPTRLWDRPNRDK